MKEFLVSLVKLYSVTIKAENETDARRYTEFFTSNINDLSEEKDRNEFKFSIEEIECVDNNVVWVEEIIEDE